MKALVIVLLLRAGRAYAQDENASAQTHYEQDQNEFEAKQKIQSDPQLAAAVAIRLSRSPLADRITSASDPNERLQQIAEWMQKDPDTAAFLAVGLASDDAQGTDDFQKRALAAAPIHLDFNPTSKKNLYNRLKKTGLDSKLLKKQEGMAGEEQSEIIKKMFEGKGAESGKIITQELEGNGGKTASKGGVVGAGGFDNSYFNRLSGGNMHGYSPQLQAMQSALNQRRVPGAPPLIETGKLDYETLSYPAYGMKYDIGNLEQRLRLERNWTIAKLLGEEGRYTQDQLLDPAVEAKLLAEARAKGVKLPERFAHREMALQRAAAAVKDFDATAFPAKDPLRISKAMLMSLGSKQKEAARWITVASLEEELERLEQQQGFLSPELVAAIEAAPVDATSRASYKRRGDEYKTKLDTIKSNGEAAVAALESDAWLSRIDAVQASLAANADLRKDLSRNIQDFVNAPYRLDALNSRAPRWRQIIDGYVKSFLPSLAYSQKLIADDKARAMLKDVFIKIAMGDLDAAHTILASYEPGRSDKSR